MESKHFQLNDLNWVKFDQGGKQVLGAIGGFEFAVIFDSLLMANLFYQRQVAAMHKLEGAVNAYQRN